MAGVDDGDLEAAQMIEMLIVGLIVLGIWRLGEALGGGLGSEEMTDGS